VVNGPFMDDRQDDLPMNFILVISGSLRYLIYHLLDDEQWS
jgi:hypothetical protein